MCSSTSSTIATTAAATAHTTIPIFPVRTPPIPIPSLLQTRINLNFTTHPRLLLLLLLLRLLLLLLIYLQ
jgi:hypothetical protein